MGTDLDYEDIGAQLVAAKLEHTIDLLRNEIDKVAAIQQRDKEFVDHRLGQLEKQAADHEQRIRSATDGVTQFKTFHTLASGGSGFMSLLALVKSFFLP